MTSSSPPGGWRRRGPTRGSRARRPSRGSRGRGQGGQSEFPSAPGARGALIQLNVNASWELDFWGRIRRVNEAALAAYLASEAGGRGVYPPPGSEGGPAH